MFTKLVILSTLHFLFIKPKHCVVLGPLPLNKEAVDLSKKPIIHVCAKPHIQQGFYLKYES